jgi:hypothetical protein
MFCKKTDFFYVVICILLFSCVGKQPLKNLDKTTVLSLIKKNNPYQCEINSKGVFYFENRISKVKFKGYLKKDCNNEFILNVLGPLNQLVYKAIYKNGKVDIFKDDKNVNRDVKAFSDEEIKLLVSVLHWPLMIPDETYDFKDLGEKYIFIKYPHKILVDKHSFKIIEIIKNKESIAYEFKGNDLQLLHYKNLPLEFKIKFY